MYRSKKLKGSEIIFKLGTNYTNQTNYKHLKQIKIMKMKKKKSLKKLYSNPGFGMYHKTSNN